jgi:hypothetical protein
MTVGRLMCQISCLVFPGFMDAPISHHFILLEDLPQFYGKEDGNEMGHLSQAKPIRRTASR